MNPSPCPSSCCLLAGLEKDIGGLKREIRERDETIGDKERRIYELKKKNQELEKFKFVLDYKIKELKKQVWHLVWQGGHAT
jgi:predicted RNase H-like nuclease (RuvC/YqgF family)